MNRSANRNKKVSSFVNIGISASTPTAEKRKWDSIYIFAFAGWMESSTHNRFYYVRTLFALRRHFLFGSRLSRPIFLLIQIESGRRPYVCNRCVAYLFSARLFDRKCVCSAGGDSIGRKQKTRQPNERLERIYDYDWENRQAKRNEEKKRNKNEIIGIR